MKATWYYPSILIFSAAAVLCTPHGIRLLAVPFKSITQVSRFVYELRPLSIYDFISFFGILFLLAGFVAITAVRKRKMRISHLLLFLGCIILLLEAKRFVNEYALLVLPLLRAYIPVIPAAPRAKVLKLVAAVLSVAFMAMPFFFMHWFFSYTPRYPVSARQLPEGVALFLKRVDGAGSVLNYPDTGGYLEWELYPRCKIFMDMQVPFLFTAEDFRTARSAFTDQGTLREVISRYRPVFITVPIEMDGFKALIAGHAQYRLLFFDDAEVLYVDGSQEPALALRYEIKTIDPFSLYSEPVRSSPDDRPSLKELLSLSEMYPHGGIVNAAITTIYQRQGRYWEAMPYADAIISTYPESHLGYKLKADLLSRLGACAQAVPLFKKAIDRSEGAMRELIETEASACTRQLRDAR
jgi:tetratricopeptide (TPR) repeat protein